MYYSDHVVDYRTAVADWTLDNCSAYVVACDESEFEHYAQWRAHAASLGFSDAYIAEFYEGYRATDDPDYRAARARLDTKRLPAVR